MKINFFTPIIFENRPKSIGTSIAETIEAYFYFGGKRALVLSRQKGNKCIEVELQDGYRPPFLSTALKVISYCTIVIPAVALIVKFALRSLYTFHILLKREEETICNAQEPSNIQHRPASIELSEEKQQISAQEEAMSVQIEPLDAKLTFEEKWAKWCQEQKYDKDPRKLPNLIISDLSIGNPPRKITSETFKRVANNVANEIVGKIFCNEIEPFQHITISVKKSKLLKDYATLSDENGTWIQQILEAMKRARQLFEVSWIDENSVKIWA